MIAEGYLRSTDEMHLRIWLGGFVFDYKATAAAVRNLIHDWMRKRWFTIELVCDTIEDRRPLPRLPCERLFLGVGHPRHDAIRSGRSSGCDRTRTAPDARP